MKNPQIFNRLVKNRGTKALAVYATLLLVMQPYALAMDQIVNKYPSGSTVAAQDIGNAHPLDVGSVFNFNNAKSPSVICLKPGEPGYPQAGCTDNLSLSEVDESNCDPESTEFTFDSGSDGWEGIRPPLQTPPATENLNLKYLYNTTFDPANPAIEVNLTRKSQTVPFVYEKKFFYECGTPGMADFKIRYRLRSNTGMHATVGTNYLKVELINPLGVVTTLVAQTNVIAADMATGWIWKPGPADTNTLTIPTSSWSESGVYKIRISGQMRTSTSGQPNVTLQFDDIKLRKTSLWADYRHDVEYFVKAAPYSQLGGAGNGYILEIKAAKKTGTADNANVLVYNGASWTNKGSISQAYNESLPQNNLQVLSIPLTDAEYNNGLVRVRYVDATQSGDPTPGGVYIDYQRIKVDQGICVQEVRAIEADCGKCHNYNGDVTKPWPSQGMHNKHAQTESVSDCAWCHPDVTAGGTIFPSDHMNGVQGGRAIEIAGTKIFRTGGANPQGAVGSWDPGTGQCTLSDCHNGLLTPAWTATYGATNGELNGTTIIARNCSRCHNTGVNNSAPAPADVNNLNIAAAWPDTLAHREHDNAFNMDENSCQANGSCHPDNRVQHTPVKDAAGVSTLMSPKYQSPSGSGVKYIKAAAALPGDGDGRCYNATCHGGQETPKWNAAVGSLDPSQPNSAYCKACHKGEKASTWTPGAILPDISAKQYNSPISGLHQGSPPTSGKSHVSEYGCAVCHTSNPTLHFKDGTGTTNLDSWQMDPIAPSDLVATMGYASGTGTTPSFTDGTAPTCATPFPGPGGLTCHAESDTTSAIGKLAGTNTSWARDWSWDAYSSNAADRCKVCHGVYGSFKNLRPAHTSPKLAGNHSDNGLDCATTCHAQTDNETIVTTNIYNHGVSMSADAKTIDVNMNVGFTQYPTAMETTLTAGGTYAQDYVMQTGTTSSVGCTGCHDSGQTTPRFSLQESGWKLRNQLTGPAVTCNSDAAGCHGDSASKRYWPSTAGTDDGATTADRIGAHELHMAWLANKVYSQTIAALLVDAATDTKQRALCQYCHSIADVDHMGATVADVFRTAPKLLQTGVAETGTLGTFNTTGNTCTNVDCHAQYGTVAAGSEAVTTPDWYITPTHTFATTTMNCSACHNNPSSDTTGKHTVHAGTSFGVNMTCASCHGASVAWGAPGTPPPTPTTHLNGTFALSSALSPAPAYTGTFRTSFGSCGTNYCHRSDASANTAPALTATWGTAQAGSCNFCHLEAMTSSKHAQHLASNSLPGTAVNECYVCHNSTATSGGLANLANHINAADDLNFNTTFANYEANTAARAAGTGTTTTCSNTKCHNGVTTPTWSSTVTCGSCHNTSATGPLPSATSVAGEHAKHANNDATYTDCAACHPNAASYLATGGNADHQNLTVNVTVGSAGYTDTTKGGVNYQAADASHTDDGSCAFTGGCHGNGANVGWAIASTLTNGCYDCHGGGLNATETGTTKPAIDAIPNPVNNTQYTSQGHGNTTTFTGSGSTGPGATFLYTGTPGCYNCHDSAATHSPAASATDPYRLGAYASNTNGMCIKAGCHDSPTILTHSKAVTGSSKTWPMTNYAFKCVDCHDPHGDSNYYMVRSHISAPTTSADASFGSDSYGTPADTANVSAVTFTSLTGMAANSYGVSGTGNGICEVCHTQTNKYIRGSATVDTHNTAGRCDSCHKHDVGFKATCFSCHGGDNPAWTNTKNYWPSAGAAYPKRPGEHDVHITRLMTKLGFTIATITDAQQKQLCDYCHSDATGTGGAGHDAIAAPVDVGSFNRLSDAAADTATAGTYLAGNGVNGTCANVDCHNNYPTTTAATSFDWYDTATSTCVMCHVKATAGNNPSSGLHYGATAPTVTGKWHDNTLTGGCAACHTIPAYSASSTHMNGTFSTLATTDPNATILGLPIAAGNRYTSAADNVGTCSGAWVGGVNCHAGAGDAGTWARKWDRNVSYATTGAECNGCHGGPDGAAWVTGVLNHDQNWNTPSDAVSDEIIGNHGGNIDQRDRCKVCHVYNDTINNTYKDNAGAQIGWVANAGSTSTYHGNGVIDFNDKRLYNSTNWTCGQNCHTAAGSHAMADSGWTVANIIGPNLTCADCHPFTTHIDADGPGGVAGDCLQCHTSHDTNQRLAGTQGVNNVYISTISGRSVVAGYGNDTGTLVPTMNLQYATHDSWIQLGGTATSSYAKSTEAEICWACHDALAISEWGTNTDTSTFTSSYDYGDLYTSKDTIPGAKTSNWVTGFWRSGKGRHSNSGTNPFWYKRGAIQSTHSVNFDSGVTALATSGNSLGFGRTEAADPVANIRCSYCHDVHGTHNGVNGDTFGGAGAGGTDTPYLRGNWKANPYAEDGAPQLKQTNWTLQGSSKYGSVPRGSASATNTGTSAVPKAGGWWIDQNSNNPNSTTNVHMTSGLCEQCHGTNKTGTWATASIGTIDWGTTGADANSANWVSGYNGHANSVLNGPGRGADASPESYARNIFTRTKRGTSSMSTSGSAHANVDMGIMTSTYSRGYSYRGLDGYGWSPTAIDQTTAFQTFAWGTPGVAATGRTSIWATGSQALTMAMTASEPANYDAQANYHTFTCSKCHNPHASRLPKLMITNCLDTNHNTWEDDTAFTGSGLPAPWTNTRHSQWASAQTCHRLDANAAKTNGMTVNLGRGWNRVTPWLEFTSPNSTRTTITPP